MLNLKRLLLAFSLAAVCFGGHKRFSSESTYGSSMQPMVIYGEGWTQQFTFINVDYYQSGQPTVGTLRFFTNKGEAWKLPIKGLGLVDRVPINHNSGGMIIIETEISQAPQQLGWAYFLMSSLPGERGDYHAYSAYLKQTSGRPDLMTSVPFINDDEEEFIIPFDNRDGKFPGIGLVNADAEGQLFTLRAYDLNGVLRKTVTRQVGARNLDWFSLIADYPDLAGFAGQLKIHAEGSYTTGAFTLLFTPSGAFMALPVVHTYDVP